MSSKTISDLTDIIVAHLNDLHEVVDQNDTIQSEKGTSKRTSNQQILTLFENEAQLATSRVIGLDATLDNKAIKRQVVTTLIEGPIPDYSIQLEDNGKIFFYEIPASALAIPSPVILLQAIQYPLGFYFTVKYVSDNLFYFVFFGRQQHQFLVVP